MNLKQGEHSVPADRDFLLYLRGFISDHKNALFDRIIRDRTRHITVVLENIYQPHNASAVIRTCDCLGIQDVHVIENTNKYEVNPDVTLGSSKWVNIRRYNSPGNNTPAAIDTLRKEGYKIVATTPHKREQSPDHLDLSQKCAILFGKEKEGLSDEAVMASDEFITIPMVGFTESFNISVAAAIILFQLTQRLRKTEIDWRLKESEITEIQIFWAKNVLSRPDLIENEFYRNK